MPRRQRSRTPTTQRRATRQSAPGDLVRAFHQRSLQSSLPTRLRAVMIPPASPSGWVAFEVEGEESGEERLAGQVGGPAVGGEDGEAPPSPVATGRHRERQEVAVERLGRRAEFVVAHQEVADDLARPRDLLQPTLPAFIGEGQVEELEGPIKGTGKPLPVAL